MHLNFATKDLQMRRKVMMLWYVWVSGGGGLREASPAAMPLIFQSLGVVCNLIYQCCLLHVFVTT